MSLVLHVGFQKTATTTLQDCVFSRHSGVVNLGKPDFDGDQAWRGALGHLISARPDKYRREWCHGILRDKIDKAARAGTVAVLSHEGLTNIYQNPPELIAERLREAFAEAEVLSTIREQLAFIQSFYLHYASYDMFRGTVKPFRRWLQLDERIEARSAIRHADFSSTIDKYIELFGRRHVHVLPFELFIRDRRAFAQQLAGTVGIGEQEAFRLMASATNRKERTSIWVYMFAVGNGMLVPEWARSCCQSYLPGRLKAGVEKWLQQGPRVSLAYPEAIAEQLRGRYRPGNRRLATEFGLCLSDYGYAV
jgi:hypothetical protein